MLAEQQQVARRLEAVRVRARHRGVAQAEERDPVEEALAAVSGVAGVPAVQEEAREAVRGAVLVEADRAVRQGERRGEAVDLRAEVDPEGALPPALGLLPRAA
ncbi:MAG: hypothetical protein G01um1014106_70 [Parcubacteria group bacterium Gr01-1014_106]|nr:MAG: hypothetical protein G01um1014106_70 [Parcubacteria group bacterium Gr01-1014_106]